MTPAEHSEAERLAAIGSAGTAVFIVAVVLWGLAGVTPLGQSPFWGKTLLLACMSVALWTVKRWRDRRQRRSTPVDEEA